MIKKILVINYMLFFLFSCSLFGGSSVSVVDPNGGLSEYKGSDFSISIPLNWSVIKENDKTIPKPGFGKIELSSTSKEVKNGFSNNLLVLSSEITNPITSKDFSIGNYVGAKKQYINYKQIENKDFTFNDGELSYLHSFEGKYNEKMVKLKFLQIGHVCKEKKVFFITIALSQDVTDLSKYENILKTFACK